MLGQGHGLGRNAIGGGGTSGGGSLADLFALTISSGTLTPAFNANVTSYTDTVTASSVTITATKNLAGASLEIQLNGGGYSSLTSGSASGSQSLSLGSNTIDIRVTGSDSSTKIYTITPYRQSTDATLSAMTISAGTLSPSFSSGTTSYTVSEDNSVSSVTITPTRNESHATIQVRVNGGSYASVTSGQASGSLALNVGSNTIDVLVTAESGATSTYTTTATRAAAWSVTKSFAYPAGNDTANSAYVRAVAINAAQKAIASTGTVNMWVKGPSQSQGVMAMKGDGYMGCASNGYYANVSGKFRCVSNANVDSTATVFDSTWHMVTCVVSSGSVTMYVDGTSGGTGTISPGADCTGKELQIGAYTSPNNAANGFDGSICHFSIWSVALSSSEVTALASGGHPANLSTHTQFANCKTWYYLGDGDATGAGNVVDHSGNGYHATITGSITIASDAP